MDIINFFYNFITKSNYTEDDKFKLMQLLKSINSVQDMNTAVKYLNHCSYIYKDDDRYNRLLYKTYCNFFKNIYIKENFFFENIYTNTYLKIIRELILELNSKRMDENNTSILVNNINYIFSILHKRDDYKIFIIDYLTNDTEELSILLAVLYLGDNYEDKVKKLYDCVYKYSEYDSIFLNVIDMLNNKG